MQYSIPKGVFDILPEEPKPEDRWRNSDHWEYVESVMRQVAHDYGFKEIRTPIFERTELFIRSVGETSDIVTKEMYTFEDKGGRSLSLRPENTASLIRSFVENNLQQKGSVHKMFYIGPMFRYERPQSGRYRQHHQFGAEAIGIAKPEQDVEVIDLLCELYRRLGLKQISVSLNSVGDPASRGPYMQALQDYLRKHFDQLSPDSQTRFSKNILRILDSKDPVDQKLLEGAPSILDTLNPESKEHFEKVKEGLSNLGIPYTLNPKLVRGLDYYNRTVFEIAYGELGAQNAIAGGGRYDGLISSFGGPDLPAVGFATGIERILQTMSKQNSPFPPPPHPTVFLIPLGEAANSFCFKLLSQLRREQIPSDMDLSGKKVQHGMQMADSLKADYAVVIGDQELETGTVKMKRMSTRESQEGRLEDIASFMKDFLERNKQLIKL